MVRARTEKCVSTSKRSGWFGRVPERIVSDVSCEHSLAVGRLFRGWSTKRRLVHVTHLRAHLTPHTHRSSHTLIDARAFVVCCVLERSRRVAHCESRTRARRPTHSRTTLCVCSRLPSDRIDTIDAHLCGGRLPHSSMLERSSCGVCSSARDASHTVSPSLFLIRDCRLSSCLLQFG